MTTAILTRKFYDLPASSTSGMGPVSTFVEHEAKGCRQRMLNSATYGDPLQRVLRELEEEWAECQSPGWDGGDAAPVSTDALIHAISLVSALPVDVPMPEAAAQASGGIGLEWYRDENRTVWISVTAAGRIHWIACAGESRMKGSAVLFDELPEELLLYIRKVTKR